MSDDQKSILKQMSVLVSELGANVEALHRSSRQNEDVSTLQTKQEELLDKLDLAFAVEAKPSAASKQQLALLRDQVSKVRDRNEEFTESLKVRLGLIQLNMDEVRRSSQALSDMKAAYLNAPKQPASGTSRPFNTLS